MREVTGSSIIVGTAVSLTGGIWREKKLACEPKVEGEG